MAFDPSTARLTDTSSAAPAAAAPAQQETKLPSAGGDAAETLYAALHGAVDTATFGLADKASAGLASGISQLTDKPMDFHEALARVKANTAKLQGNSPVATLIGDAAGLVAGGGALNAGAKAAGRLLPGSVGRVAEALALKQGAPIANTLKTAAVGGGVSATDTALRGGGAEDVALSGAVGAVAAPIISKAASVAIRTMQPAAKKAMGLLASKIGESADTLEKAFLNFSRDTGRAPTMAELVGMKSTGELKKIAANNSEIGDAAITAKDAANARRTTTLPQQIERTTGAPPQDINTLVQSRKQRMTAALDPIRENPVLLEGDDAKAALLDPRTRSAVRSTRDPGLMDDYTSAVEALEAGDASTLSVKQMDAIRQSLRNKQGNFANPTSSTHNSLAATGHGELADQIGELASRENGGVPEYGAALKQFGQDSDYIKGFKHGNAGKTEGEAADPELIKALAAAHGKEGFASGVQSRLTGAAQKSESSARTLAKDLSEKGDVSSLASEALGPNAAAKLSAAGRAETKAAKNLNEIAPSSPEPDSEFSGKNVAQAAAAAGSHSISGTMFHMIRAIPGLTKTLPPAQQKIVAKYLLDPTMTKQGINILRKAGASNDDLRKLALAIGAASGVQTSDTVSGR